MSYVIIFVIGGTVGVVVGHYLDRRLDRTFRRWRTK